MITVEKLIEYLMKVENKSAVVMAEKGNNDGCDTCGFGESYTEYNLSEVNDLETRVILVFNE